MVPFPTTVSLYRRPESRLTKPFSLALLPLQPMERVARLPISTNMMRRLKNFFIVGVVNITCHLTMFILRYHEIALKGGNRSFFETRLGDHLKAVFSDLPEVTVRNGRDHFRVEGDVPDDA